MQNLIGEADLEWILHRNCEGTEQLPDFFIMYMTAGRDFSGSLPADSFLKQQEHIYRYRV